MRSNLKIKPFPDIQPVTGDVFSGAGGLSLGFQMAGYQITFGIETDEHASKTHHHNFNGCCYRGKIEDIPDPASFLIEYGLLDVDIIIGGPPCQGFSRVGRGKIRHLRKDPSYIHDPRNTYYKEFLRFIRASKPLYFVLENVPDMAFYRDGDGPLLDKIRDLLRDMGYFSEWRILQADHYGSPQTRKRLFLIGNNIGNEIAWPERSVAKNPVTVWEAISDLPIVPPGHREDVMKYIPRCPLNPYQQFMRRNMKPGEEELLFNHQTRWHNDQDLEAFSLMPQGGKYVDLPSEYKRYRDDIFKDKYRKLYRDRPSWTIEAHIGKDSYRYIYPSLKGQPEPHRTISVREAARLQGFPDHFRFSGPFTQQFRQIGNAVPPLLGKAVAEAILPGLMAGIEQKHLQSYRKFRRKKMKSMPLARAKA